MTYDFKGVSYHPDSHELFAVVAAVHHEGVCKSFDDWTLCFAETLNGIAASRVGDVDRSADLDIVTV